MIQIKNSWICQQGSNQTISHVLDDQFWHNMQSYETESGEGDDGLPVMVWVELRLTFCKIIIIFHAVVQLCGHFTFNSVLW